MCIKFTDFGKLATLITNEYAPSKALSNIPLSSDHVGNVRLICYSCTDKQKLLSKEMHL